MQAKVDVEGMDELLAILNGAQKKAVAKGKRVVGKGSLNIKNDWRRRWKKLDSLRHLPYALGYDIHTVGTTITGEIGPPLESPQGGLAHVLEEGTINNPGGQPAGLPALEKEAPAFIAQVEKLAVDLLEGRL
jgi:hypothetical protein